MLPEGTKCDTPRTVFGAGLRLRAGRRTIIDRINRDQSVLVARVQAISNGVTFPVAGGVLHLAVWPDDRPHEVMHTQGQIVNGAGRVVLRESTLQDLMRGRRIWFSLAKAADNALAAAKTPPATLR